MSDGQSAFVLLAAFVIALPDISINTSTVLIPVHGGMTGCAISFASQQVLLLEPIDDW